MESNPTPVNCKTAKIHELKKAYYEGVPISGLELLATHYGTHNDEIHAEWLMMRTLQGRFLFPGIEHASNGFLSTTNLRESNMLGKEGFFKAMQQGVLLLGIGGGPLDEHGDREKRISCTEMVVRLLDLRKDKEDRKLYGRLIEYVNFEDGNGDAALQCLNRARKESDPKLNEKQVEVLLKLQIGAFSQNLKKGFEAAGSDPDKQKEIFDMAFKFYDNEIAQTKLFMDAEKAYESAVKHVIPLTTPSKAHKFVLLEMQSDALAINKVVHSKWRDNRTEKLAVLFLHKSNGQFVIMPNQQYFQPDEMREIVKILRQTVARNANKGYYPIAFNELGRDEAIQQIPEIYFDKPTGVISNGSKVDPDVHGLIGDLLSVQDVIEAIQIALDTSFYAPKFAAGCVKGECARSKCFMYQLGLQRCHDVRLSNNQFAEVRKVTVHK